MKTKSESGRIRPRLILAEDSTRFIALDVSGKEFLTEDLSLYLAVKPEIEEVELTALVNALAIACDQIICIINSDHPLFAQVRMTRLQVQ